jgi:sterol desaturase/sphingolipid hydroxylase (fatty acid hydroxylase superfamily)
MGKQDTNTKRRFGVTSKFWDYVWGTQLEYAKPLKTQ